MNSLEEQNRYYQTIQKALLYVDENYKEQPNVETIASHIGLSKAHFSRIFKSYVGVTPMQFLQATTLSHAKKHLENSKSILETSLELGLSSSSRLHDLFLNFEAITPNEYKKLGEQLTITYGVGYSPFGKAFISQSARGIMALMFYEDSFDEMLARVKKDWAKAEFVHDDKAIQNSLDSIFVHHRKQKLFVKGTNLQVNVWKALLTIPYGNLTTYSEVAQKIGNEKAVRAVASSIGKNPISILIPCHRVVGKTAAMSGYAWGINRKRIILACESLQNS